MRNRALCALRSMMSKSSEKTVLRRVEHLNLYINDSHTYIHTAYNPRSRPIIDEISNKSG